MVDFGRENGTMHSMMTTDLLLAILEQEHPSISGN